MRSIVFTPTGRAMELLIQPLNRVIHVDPGTNLLEALRAAQIPMSYSCLAGRCGTCRCTIVEGEVFEGGDEQQRPFTAQDQTVLACRTYVTSPCTIEIAEPDEVVVHTARIVKASVAAIETMTHDIVRIVLKPAKPIEFSPGQYVQLQFGPDHVRPYSMAGLTTDANFEFHVRVVPGGKVSQYIAQTLKVGDAVRVSGPLGSAYLRRKHEGPMLCVAGGTGLAPILSIVRGALDAGMTNPIHLYFGVRSARDIYGLDWLQALAARHPALKLHVVVTSGDVPEGCRRGVVTEAIEADLRDLADWRAYLCGSPPMVEATTLLARRLGMAAECVYADAFYATTP